MLISIISRKYIEHLNNHKCINPIYHDQTIYFANVVGQINFIAVK